MMESPTKSKTGEATGISRSGRVRKKSSKLTDFESPDEIDTRFKRRTDRPQKVVAPKALSEDSDSYLDEDIDVKDEPLEVDDWGVEGEEMEEGEEEEEEEESVGGEDGGGEGNLPEYSDPLQVDEDSTDVSRETSNYSQAQSLYFSEKQGKKSIVMKGGQVVRRKKAQRKDKGKSRFTAYMLWAREIRPGIIQANPNMDFSAVNKRLGELWALVPTTQKYNWKRRAKRLAAKGNQKGGLISTGRPSRPPPPARANLINKGGVKPAPRPDPNPTPPPASLATQGTGHHRQSGQKPTKSRGKRLQPRDSSSATPQKRLSVYPSLHSPQSSPSTSESTFKREYLKKRPPKQPHITMHNNGSDECTLKHPAPLGQNTLLKKQLEEDKKLDSTNQKKKQLKAKTRGEKTERDDEKRSMKGTHEVDEALRQNPVPSKGIPEADGTVASPRDNTLTTYDGINTCKWLHQPMSAAEEPDQPPDGARDIPCTVGDIFRDLIKGGLSPYCPLSLIQAVAAVVQYKSSIKRASARYCVSPTRVLNCLSLIKYLKESKCEMYHPMLKKLNHYPPVERIREWLLRMKRMGRSPVISDIKQVFRFTGTVERRTYNTDYFMRLYGAQTVSQEEWAVLSLRSSTQWDYCFQDHIFFHRTTPKLFLTEKNSLRVFTSAEVLLGLGDLPGEVVVTRGRSNLYCLTQQEQGVAQGILTFSAAGQFCPPVIIQKGYYIPHWALSEDSVDLIASPDGRWDPLVFLSWLRLFEQRLTVTGVPRPVLLFVHGHPAHASPAVDAFCSAKGIILHSHHHSAINPMDPFIHLIPPFLHHFARTQEQLTALTGVHTLPDYLLPSVLADAWTQLSKENLAGEAFRRSGLLPYTVRNCFPVEKFTKMSFFPPLMLTPPKTYFSIGDPPVELPYHPEPQQEHIIHNLYAAKLCQKLSILDQVKLTKDISTCSGGGNDVEEDFDMICEPQCVAAESSNDSSVVESGTVALMQDDADNSSDTLPKEEFEDLPLECELQEQYALGESVPSSLDNHASSSGCESWEKAEDFDNSDQVCDPLFIGPDPMPDPSVIESSGIIHVHRDTTTTTVRSPPTTLEEAAEQLHSSFASSYEKFVGCSEPRISSPQKEIKQNT